jgi:hypothetical protein
MNIEEYRDCFKGISVCLNWQQAFCEQWQVTSSHIWSPDGIRDIYMPWYLSSSGTPASYTDQAASPVTVGKVADNIDVWPTKRARIDCYRYKFLVDPKVVPISLPAYSLPNNGRLLLDGNHRAVALAIARVKCEVTLVSICGPISSGALPDLSHWETRQK